MMEIVKTHDQQNRDASQTVQGIQPFFTHRSSIVIGAAGLI
jgi:hypothetical protein